LRDYLLQFVLPAHERRDLPFIKPCPHAEPLKLSGDPPDD